MNKPRLYSFRRCPYAIRARMALACSEIKVELREVSLRDMPRELIAISPKATVPVLHLADGTVLEQSLDVMVWALSISDPRQWLVDDCESKQLIRQNDEEFKGLLDAYKYADRYPQSSPTEHRDRAAQFLRGLEHRLQKHAFLTGDRYTMVDVAIMPFIRQFAGVEPAWFEHCEYAALRRWLNQQLDSGLFKSVMRKVAVWKPGDQQVCLIEPQACDQGRSE